MKFTVLTLFPKLVEAFATEGLIGQAAKNAQISVSALNPRQFTNDNHQTVDDRVYGGRDGMVMKVEPLAAAVAHIRAQGPTRVVVLSPQGKLWSQSQAQTYAERGEDVILVCGRYAGIDHRFTVASADAEVSLGDFILNGGEIAACAVIESIVRLRPGVLGNAVSALKDSFSDGFLECPQFTRPRQVGDLEVPEPLLSGNHKNVERFELAVARVRTAILRPDLIPGLGENRREDLKILFELPQSQLKSLGLSTDLLQSLEQSW